MHGDSVNQTRGITMQYRSLLFPLSIPSLLSSVILSHTNAVAGQKITAAYIEPPMIAIPAGNFYMGSDRGQDNEKPAHKVSMPAFQMAKYEVTIAEFRKFIEATHYQAPQECTHRIGDKWFGSGKSDGSWDNNIYAHSEFHPVVCITRKDAIAYAKWLSQQSGKQYRLPTEAEWEYALRGGTYTRYFYGDEPLSGKSCEYANLSDVYALHESPKQYDASYKSGYTIEPCNDHELTTSVVGLYKANPFGIHDMIGNVVERLADCYQNSYHDAPTDGSAVTKEQCDTYVARGGSWHWEAHRSSQRMPIGDNFVAALEGFRLVQDTQGQALPNQQGNQTFVKLLTHAQEHAKKDWRKTNIQYPTTPKGLEVVSSSHEAVTLQWQYPITNQKVSFNVYRQDPITLTQQHIASNLKQPTFTDPKPLERNMRYAVSAILSNTESIASDFVDSGISTIHQLPAKIEGEAFSSAPNIQVSLSGWEEKDDRVFAALSKHSAHYTVNVPTSNMYKLQARVFHPGSTQHLEFWLGDKLLTKAELTGERSWQTIDNIFIDLPKGQHQLSVKGQAPLMALNWFIISTL